MSVAKELLEPGILKLLVERLRTGAIWGDSTYTSGLLEVAADTIESLEEETIRWFKYVDPVIIWPEDREAFEEMFVRHNKEEYNEDPFYPWDTKK